MADIVEALVGGAAALLQSAAAKMLATTFADAKALVGSLFDGDAGTSKPALEKVKKDFQPIGAFGEALKDKIEPEFNKAKDAAVRMAAELDKDFTLATVARAMQDFATIMTALGAAIDQVADAAAAKETGEAKQKEVRAAVRGIKEPWARPFQLAADGATGDFDLFVSELFGFEGGAEKLLAASKWDRDAGTITTKLDTAGSRRIPKDAPEGAAGASFDGGYVEVFVGLQEPVLGFRVRTTITPALTSDKLLGKMMPGGSPKTDAALVTIDSKDGLTFGDGKDHRILLPFRAGGANSEIRDLAISRPEQSNGGERIDVSATIAGRLGPIKGVVAEGGGLTFRWRGGGQGLEVLPKPPTGVGVKIEAGPIKGGGYVRHREAEGDYGGVLDLQIGPIKATAVGLIDPDPFSFIVVIGVRFTPSIELSFGFTLNAVGGLFAIERGFDTDALRAAIAAGAVSNLLFPDNPVSVAPTILDQLAAIFPPAEGSFVLGPMLELGWGSKTGLVRAKLGLVIAIPGEGVTLLGSLQVAAPPELGDLKFRAIDLRIDAVAIINPPWTYIEGKLINSKLAGLKVDGDLRAYIDVGRNPVMALSAGGFFKGYDAPPKMEGMKPIKLDLVAKFPIKHLTVTGYAALTSNSVQWGGAVHLEARVGPVAGRADLSIDAMFQWAPRLHFLFQISAEVEITAFDQTVAAVKLVGRISGTSPWSFFGYASVGILFWEAELPIGPIEWGGKKASPLALVNPVEAVVDALKLPSGTRRLMPADGDRLAIMADPGKVDLSHPLAAFEVRQFSVPLEIEIDRIGAAGVTTRRVHLENPRINTHPAAAAWEVRDSFAIGQFLNLTDEQQVGRPYFEIHAAGGRIAAADGATAATERVANYAWETRIPRSGGRFANMAMALRDPGVLRHSAAAVQRRAQANPYGFTRPVAPVTMAEPGLKQVLSLETMTALGAENLGVFVSTSQAARQAEAVGAGAQLVGMGAMR